MSTYSSSLRITLIASGDQAGQWGNTTNENLAYILDTSIAGYQNVPVSATPYVLTYTTGPTATASANQSVYAMLQFTATTSGAFTVFAPPVSKMYIIRNNSVSQVMTLYNSTVIGNTTAAGAGVTIAVGDKVLVWSDGTNFFEIKTNNVTGTVAIANGGTGQTTANAALNALLPSQTSNANKYLQTDGTNTSWDAVNLSTSDITGTLAVTNGGTGQSTALTQYGVIYGSTTTAMATTLAGTSTQVLHGNSSGAPTWGSVSLSADVSGTLPVANGGTGVTTSTGAGSVVLSVSPALTGTPTAPTAAVSTDSTQIATTAFVRDIIPTGVITLWYGSIASIPTGWLLCDGTNSTPDLRDRFIVGAGTTYAVAATGGSANATLVSHTHTATSTSTFTGTALGTHTHTDSGHQHGYSVASTTQAKPLSSGQPAFIGTSAVLTDSAQAQISSVSAGTPAGTVATTTTNSTEGSSATNANLPPYYALAYIMKA
jgi:hypothetical protein